MIIEWLKTVHAENLYTCKEFIYTVLYAARILISSSSIVIEIIQRHSLLEQVFALL